MDVKSAFLYGKIEEEVSKIGTVKSLTSQDQCKKQTVVANSTTEAEYVAASSCYGQVLWIQNQLLDYGYNFMHTKIFIDNNRKAKKSVRLMMEKLFGMELELILLHALVDGKKIIVTESIVRRYLQLEDAKGIDCLPNSTIFEELTRMGSKTTAWNEFSSTMVSAIICLATNQKFNFSKYIFKRRPTHKRIYDAPSHTKKIFGNMKRVGKGFSGRVTPLFPTMVVQNQAELGEGSAMPTDPHHTPTIIESSSQPQKTQKPRKPKRKDTQVPQPSGPTDIVADEAVHKELGDSLVRAATTASSLEAEQDSGNITKTRSKATPNESSSLGTTSGGGPRCQETMGDTIAQTRFKNVSKLFNDSLLARVGLSARVESSSDEEDLGEDASKQGRRINAIDADEDITLVSVQDDADAEMFDVNTLTGDEVFAEQEVAAKGVNLTVDEVTLDQELAALKSVKPKLKGVVIQEPSTTTTTTIFSQQQSHAKVQDKGKGKMVEPELMKRTKKKVQIMLDEVIVLKLQVEIDKEEIIARAEEEKINEANIAWDDIQAKVDVDYQLAERLQAEEQEQFTIEEKATLFKELLEQRRKHFAAKRAEEKRNKPPTKTQQKMTMITYLKNMEDLVEGSSKRAGEELEQESTKKQKVDEDKDTAELQSLMEVIPDKEEVTINDVPLATKPPTIVDWKIHKEGKKSYYQIEDLEDLYKLVKAKYKSTRAVEDLYLMLWSDLKTMFKPHVEDEIWKLQQRYPLTPPRITDMLNKKLQVRIVGIKSFLNAASITAALIDVNTSQSKLVLLENFNENYSK
ncbi:hypothetical protein Tco_0000416 [Tanacetum coccineum]